MQEAAAKEQQEKVHKLGIEESTKAYEIDRLSTEVRNKEREASQGSGGSLSSAQSQLREAAEESKAAGDKLQTFQESYIRQTNDLRTTIKVGHQGGLSYMQLLTVHHIFH